MNDVPNLKSFKPGTLVLRAYEHTKIDEELDLLPTSELLDLYDEIAKVTAPYTAEPKIDWEKAKKIEAILATRFGYPLHTYYTEDLTEKFNEIINQLNLILETFKNHRHCLDKTYGEKPVW